MADTGMKAAGQRHYLTTLSQCHSLERLYLGANTLHAPTRDGTDKVDDAGTNSPPLSPRQRARRTPQTCLAGLPLAQRLAVLDLTDAEMGAATAQALARGLRASYHVHELTLDGECGSNTLVGGVRSHAVSHLFFYFVLWHDIVKLTTSTPSHVVSVQRGDCCCWCLTRTSIWL